MARGLLRIPTLEDQREPEEHVNQALAAFGLVAEEPLALEEDFVLWPECVPAFRFWFAVQSQWRRTGDAGRATGLDYTAVKALMDMRGIPEKDRTELFDGLQVMEKATLEAWKS